MFPSPQENAKVEENDSKVTSADHITAQATSQDDISSDATEKETEVELGDQKEIIGSRTSVKSIDYKIVHGHPLMPSKLKRSEILPDPSKLKHIDTHMKKVMSLYFFFSIILHQFLKNQIC